LIEGKLMDMEKEPKNVQVVVQGTSEHSTIFLIDENGIICTVKSREHGVHVSQPVDERVEESSVRSALRDTDNEVAQLKRTLATQNEELQGALERLREAREALDAEKRESQQRSEELNESMAALEKEKRKVKKIWREKCELQLSHEDAMDEKDGDSETEGALACCPLAWLSAHTRRF